MDDYNGNDRNRCEEIMRRLLAVVLCILIGVQGMILIPGGMKVQAEDMAENTVTVGPEQSLYNRELWADDVN